MENNEQINTVLIVDDIPENLQVLGNILLSKGLDVGFATNGFQALETISINPPDLILLDVMMPGMSGFTVCEKLKQNPDTKDIPVIFLTAKAQTEDIIKGFEVGAVDYVTKPFNSGELIARVMTQLEIKKSRDIINRQNSQLLELNATKDKFFSIIAHDLRGPFMGLIGLTELMNEDDESMDDDTKRDINRKIHDTLVNQYKLLENLLQWAQMQTGRIEYLPTTINLSILTSDVIAVLQSNADRKKIRINHHITDTCKISADRMMMRSILHNLVSNAIKFTFENGSIDISCEEFNHEYMKITIADTGVGIDPIAASKIFRIDTTHTTVGTNKEKGTGLGLIICKEMIEVNKGKIWFEPNAPTGAKFSIILPKANL